MIPPGVLTAIGLVIVLIGAYRAWVKVARERDALIREVEILRKGER